MASPSQYRLLHGKGQSSLSLPAGSYIYSLCQSGIDALAAISSDNSLRRFDRETLKVLPNGVFANIHPGNSGGVTCVCEVDPVVAEGKTLVATSGRDGTVKLWDSRDKRRDAVLTATSGKILMPMQSNMELLRPLAALILIPLTLSFYPLVLVPYIHLQCGFVVDVALDIRPHTSLCPKNVCC